MLGVDAEPLLLLDEQEPLVSLPLHIEARSFGVLVRKAAAAHKEIAQVNLALGVDKLLFGDALAVDGAKITGAPAGHPTRLVGEKKMTKLIIVRVMMIAHSQV